MCRLFHTFVFHSNPHMAIQRTTITTQLGTTNDFAVRIILSIVPFSRANLNRNAERKSDGRMVNSAPLLMPIACAHRIECVINFYAFRRHANFIQIWMYFRCLFVALPLWAKPFFSFFLVLTRIWIIIIMISTKLLWCRSTVHRYSTLIRLPSLHICVS